MPREAPEIGSPAPERWGGLWLNFSLVRHSARSANPAFWPPVEQARKPPLRAWHMGFRFRLGVSRLEETATRASLDSNILGGGMDELILASLSRCEDRFRYRIWWHAGCARVVRFKFL